MALTKTKEVSGIFTLNIYRQLDIQIEYLEGKNTNSIMLMVNDKPFVEITSEGQFVLGSSYINYIGLEIIEK